MVCCGIVWWRQILTRPESKSSGVVYTDAKRWYKMPPGMNEVVPKKLRLAPTARPQTVPASFDNYEPIPLSKRRFPDLNLPFSTVEQNPTANYTAIHSAMAHNVNNAIPNPLAASKAASRAAFFQSSSIAANASVATADGKLQSTSQVDTKTLAPTVTRLSPSAKGGAGKGSAAPNGNGSGSGSGSGSGGSDSGHSNAIPTRVNYKRRSFIARNFFHQEGVFESQSGVTNAYQYFKGSRPFGARPQYVTPTLHRVLLPYRFVTTDLPLCSVVLCAGDVCCAADAYRTHQSSRTTVSGYPFDMYTKQL